MTPTGLPISTPASTGAPATAATPAAQSASADFMLMLAQLISATNVPGAIAATPVAIEGAPAPQTDSDAEVDAEDAAVGQECAGLAALLPIAFAVAPPPPPPMQTPLQGQTTPDAIATVQMQLSDILGDAAANAAANKLIPKVADPQLSTELMDTAGGTPSADGSVAGTPPGTFELPHPLRATAAHEAMMSRPVAAPVGTPAWTEEIGARMTWMAEQGRHTASLKLSPEQLGPLEIRISIREDQASVWFGAAHADTRAAIEHALPRLREMFAAQGLSLTDAGVFQEAPRDRLPTLNPPNNSGGGEGEGNSNEVVIRTTRGRIGLVDAYA
jgi:flagellar hook-length control protein FliK